MATLTVPITDLSLTPKANVEIFAYLSDVKGNHLTEFTTEGMAIGPEKAITDSSGVAVFDLIPNEDIDRIGTFYSIDVAGSVAPVVIYKSPSSETLAAARVFDPVDLSLPAGLGDLWDVDTTGVNPGDTLRYSSGRFIAWPWPTGGGGSDKPWGLISADRVMVPADSASNWKVDASAAPILITLPTAVGNMGLTITFKRVNLNNLVTLNAPPGNAIDGSLTFAIDMQWMSVSVSSDDNNWMVI
jgi:hypothetical protein